MKAMRNIVIMKELHELNMKNKEIKSPEPNHKKNPTFGCWILKTKKTEKTKTSPVAIFPIIGWTFKLGNDISQLFRYIYIPQNIQNQSLKGDKSSLIKLPAQNINQSIRRPGNHCRGIANGQLNNDQRRHISLLNLL